MEENVRTLLQLIDLEKLDELMLYIELLRYCQKYFPNIRYLTQDEVVNNIRNIQTLIPHILKIPELIDKVDALKIAVNHLMTIENRVITIENEIKDLPYLRLDIDLLKQENIDIRNRLKILERDNKYLVILQSVRNNMKLIHDTYHAKLAETVGAAMVYHDTEDIAQDINYYSYAIIIDIGIFETYPYNVTYKLHDDLILQSFEYTITVQQINETSNQLVVTLNNSIILNTTYDINTYIQICIYRHAVNIFDTPNSYSMFQSGCRVVRYTPLMLNDLPYVFNESLPLNSYYNYTIAISENTKFTVKFELPDDSGVYAIAPAFRVQFASTISEIFDFAARVAFIFQYNLLMSLMDDMLQTTTTLAMEDKDYNTILESQVLANTQSIAQLLTVLNRVPIYDDFEFSRNLQATMPHGQPALIIQPTYSIPGATTDDKTKQTDGMLATINGTGRMIVLSLLQQRSNIDTSTIYNGQSTIYEDDKIIIIALLTMSRTKPNGDTTIGGRFIPKKMPNALTISGPYGSGKYKYINYTQLVHDGVLGTLSYTDTYTEITLNSIFIGFKNTFATPTNVSISGTIVWNCFNQTKSLAIANYTSAEFVTNDNIKYFGCMIRAGIASYFHFDQELSYNILKPSPTATKQGVIYQGDLHVGTNLQSEFFRVNTDNVSIDVQFGYRTDRGSSGGGQYLDFESYSFYGGTTLSVTALENILYSGTTVPVNSVLTSDIQLNGLNINCLVARAVGYSDLIQSIRANEMSLSALAGQLGLLMSEIMNRLTTVESRLNEVEKILQELIKPKTVASLILDMVVDAILTYVAGAVAPLLEALFKKLATTLVAGLAKATYYIATKLVVIGKTVLHVITYTIPNAFVAFATQLQMLVRKWMVKKDKVSVYTSRLHEAFIHSKADAYQNIPLHIRRLNPELQLAEAINTHNVHSKNYLNIASVNGDKVVSYMETNFHGLTKLGKLPQLKQATVGLLDSKLGGRLIKNNKAPVHAYVVTTEVTRTTENTSKLSRCVMGVMEGVDDKGVGKVFVNSVKFEWTISTVNGKTVAALIPLDESDLASSLRLEMFYKKNFPKGLHTTPQAKYVACASKFAGNQESTWKSMPFALPSSHRIDAAHEVFREPKYFDYNLLTNNCQSFSADMKQFLSSGYVSGSLKPQASELSGAYVSKLLSDLTESVV